MTPGDPEEVAGLCASCRHAQAIEGERSTFWRCSRHESEPERFPRFPELPVRRCPGYEEGDPDVARRGDEGGGSDEGRESPNV